MELSKSYESHCIGMTRAPSKVFIGKDMIGMSRAAVLNKIFHAPGFIYPPPNAIIQLDWIIREDYSMGMNDACICGSGKKRKRCHADLYEGSAVAHLWGKIHQIDEEVTRQKLEHSVDFFCKSGCNACCKEYFYVSALEYFLIKNQLLTFNPKLFSRVKQESIQQCAVLETLYPEESKKLRNPVPLFQMFQDKEHLEQFEFCPLLDKENGKCMIYQARTAICRLYGISYLYSCCDQINQQFKSSQEKQSIMVGVPFDQALQMDMDFFRDENNRDMFSRPYPLFYWFANDEKYEEHYNIAMSRPYQDYWKFVWSNGY